MKRMVWNFPVESVGIFLNADQVKIGFYNVLGGRFYDDLPVYEGSMGDLMFKIENREFWNKIRMKKVNHIKAENNVLVIGADRFDDD